MKRLLASTLLSLLAATWRIQVNGSLPTTPTLVAFWHGQMLPIWYTFRGKGAVGVVSQSNDGSLLAHWLVSLGFALIRGSSSKGGSEVLASIQTALDHAVVLITPDGPRGPACVAKLGVAVAAQRAAVGIVCISMTSNWQRTFKKSWDSFQLPLPFSRIVLTVSKPIIVGEDDDVATALRTIETELDRSQPC